MKTAPPRLPAGFVRRRPLTELLNAAARGPVTMVCAPAGYGKTLLLADWIESTGAPDKAWLSLDSLDDQPIQFWTAVLAAIRSCDAVPADNTVRTLVPPVGVSGIPGLVARLVDALDALPTRITLVLDDLHQVTSPETMHGIEILIRHQPDSLALVLSSRLDPPLPLARLRLQGRLRALRTDDLRFSVADAAELVTRAGAAVSEDQVGRLVDETEGWAAGLQLAVPSLRRMADPEAFLADLAHDDHAIADYLVDDVLAFLPEERWRFLTAVSVCDEVTAALAEALTGRADAGVILGELERDNALVLSVGRERRWYRIHPLLVSYLRSDLDRRQPGTAARLHRRAAHWFASEALPRRALDHATRARAPATTRELLRDHAVALLMNGDHEIVDRALTSLGAEAVSGDAWLSLISAATRLEQHDFTVAGRSLAGAERVPPPVGTPDVASLRRLVTSTYALSRGQPVPVEEVPWHQVDTGHDRPAMEAWARIIRGWSLLSLGNRDAARRELAAADYVAHALGLDYLVVHGHLASGLMAGLNGDLPAMATACSEVIAAAEEHSWETSPWLAMSHVMLGYADMMQFNPVGALAEVARVTRSGHPPAAPRLRYMTAVVEGGALFDKGMRWAGLRLMRRARTELADVTVLPELVAGAALIECQCAYLLGQSSMARDTTVWARRHLGETAEVSLMTAWSELSSGEKAAADRALERALHGSQRQLIPATEVEAWLLRSAEAIRSGRRTTARAALAEAVRMAEPSVLVRPFRHAEPPVRRLLLDQLGGFGGSDHFVARARSALYPTDDGRIPRLTAREHAVLRHLTSQRSLDELATDFSVSVNTIKTHVRAIYLKLGVNSRRAAVLQAREQGLA